MIEEVMLTTVDNPFNPFEDFDNWFKYDIEKGYYSCSKLARLVKIQDGMTELEIAKATEDAIFHHPLLPFCKSFSIKPVSRSY